MALQFQQKLVLLQKVSLLVIFFLTLDKIGHCFYLLSFFPKLRCMILRTHVSLPEEVLLSIHSTKNKNTSLFFPLLKWALYIPNSVKIVQIRSFFWSVFSRIWTEYGEIRSHWPASLLKISLFHRHFSNILPVKTNYLVST